MNFHALAANDPASQALSRYAEPGVLCLLVFTLCFTSTVSTPLFLLWEMIKAVTCMALSLLHSLPPLF